MIFGRGFLPLALDKSIKLRGSSASFGPLRVFYFPGTHHFWRAFPYPPTREAPDGRLATSYGLKKIIRFQKRRPHWDLEKLYVQKQRVHNTLKEKLGATRCESGNVEVQWNNTKECVSNTLSGLVGKVERRARKP